MRKAMTVFVGYIAGAFAAAVVFATLIAVTAGTNLFDGPLDEALLAVLFVATMVAFVALPVGLPAIGIAWWRRIGHPAYYVAAALAACILTLVVFGGQAPEQRLEGWSAMAAALCSAAVAGVVFWSVAGRRLARP